MVVNLASMVFMLPLFVFAFFPISTPVTAGSMNYGVVMFGGIVLLAALYYVLGGRKIYTAPVAHVKWGEDEL